MAHPEPLCVNEVGLFSSCCESLFFFVLIIQDLVESYYDAMSVMERLINESNNKVYYIIIIIHFTITFQKLAWLA